MSFNLKTWYSYKIVDKFPVEPSLVDLTLEFINMPINEPISLQLGSNSFFEAVINNMEHSKHINHPVTKANIYSTIENETKVSYMKLIENIPKFEAEKIFGGNIFGDLRIVKFTF